ncbi:MAG TPA: hypothetical protein DEO32_06505 [Ruminococcaceae bacterium]|nr:hypothetical protein [Oscillospiraceae bacterium]
MKISNKAAYAVLTVLIILSLAASCFFMNTKLGYHEDELLNYNLANSPQLLLEDSVKNELSSGKPMTPDDIKGYLAVSDNNRFNYGMVYQNQIVDGVHPPFYYSLVNTVCSFFPNTFNKWLGFIVNAVMMAAALVLLFRIGKRVSGSNLYALIAAGGYALSIACVTTTIYLRMYAVLTFFVLAFLAVTLRIYDRKNEVKIIDLVLMLVTVTLGILTQYYFVVFAGLIGLVFLIFSIKDKHIKTLVKYIITAVAGAGIALAVYPNMLMQVLGSDRGVGSTGSLSIDFITVFTYVGYKLLTYVQVLSKDMFLGQQWLFFLCAFCMIAAFVYFRFVKKQKTPRKAWFLIVPGVFYFIGIALISPFNSDRYVMASMPMLSMIFIFGFIKLVNLIKNPKLHIILPASVLIASAIGFICVKPYYTYGTSTLYDVKTKDVLFVGTPMQEWNKNLDKFMLYDTTTIVQTSMNIDGLVDEIEDFATSRGVVTNGKIGSMVDSFIDSGSGKGDAESKENNLKSTTIQTLENNSTLKSKDKLTVYISRLADNKAVIDYIQKTLGFKTQTLIEADKSLEDYYNWYDYFVETESYCNVYEFTK